MKSKLANRQNRDLGRGSQLNIAVSRRWHDVILLACGDPDGTLWLSIGIDENGKALAQYIDQPTSDSAAFDR